MRGRPNAPRTILAIVDPGSGCRRTIPCDGSRRWPTRLWRVCRRRSTACTPRWAGPRYRPSGCRGLSAHCPVLGAQRARHLRGTRIQPAVPLVPGHGPDRAQLRCLHQEPVAAAGARRGTRPDQRGGVGGRCGELAVARSSCRPAPPVRSGSPSANASPMPPRPSTPTASAPS